MRLVPCPQCATPVEWDGNPHRPFCSDRCRVIDLGAWLDEKYVIEAPPADESDEDERPRPAKHDDGDES